MHGENLHSENKKGKDDLGELNADELNRLHLLFPPCLPYIMNSASLSDSLLSVKRIV